MNKLRPYFLLLRCLLEPLLGSVAILSLHDKWSAWVGHRGDIGEGIWAGYGFMIFFAMALINGPLVWASREVAKLATGMCLLALACWWLHPLSLFPFRAPFYLGVCAFWLFWPYWIVRRQAPQGPKPSLGFTKA
ncbi:MAG: hypothetical protein KF760_11550 [Candidatus Eremiobacteraeota bacterium]|nr:hypothetical protein [Candidatus Eremiobacteraeota bacterium]MCW5870987.1 hypothetical protein [Candidatus Eremiobacteraeota bacterium]